MVYVSRGLDSIHSMTAGWARDAQWNRFWHWYKHAFPTILNGKIVKQAEMGRLPSDDAYLDLARDICRAAARGEEGTDVKVREVVREDSLFWHEWLIWYQPPGLRDGLFLVVKVVGTKGELKTMFPPEDGRAYFDRQEAAAVH